MQLKSQIRGPAHSTVLSVDQLTIKMVTAGPCQTVHMADPFSQLWALDFASC